MKWIAWMCRIALSAVFLAAAVPKILDPHGFAVAVFRYQMAPYPLVNLLAIYLPWIELVAAIALLVPRANDAAAFLMTGMLALFTTAIAVNLFRGIDIACGCFTVDPDAGRIGWRKVAENIGLIVMAVVAWRQGLGCQVSGVREGVRNGAVRPPRSLTRDT